MISAGSSHRRYPPARNSSAGALQARPEQRVAAAIAVDDEDRREIGKAVRHLGQIFAVGDQGPGAAVGEPVLERVGTELGEERQRHGAELVDREMRDRRFRALRQQHADPIARPYSHRRERIRAAVRQAFQFIVR